MHMRKYKVESMPKAIKKRIEGRGGPQLSRRNSEDRSDNCHRENNLKTRHQESKSIVIWEIILGEGRTTCKGSNMSMKPWSQTGLGVTPTAWPL